MNTFIPYKKALSIIEEHKGNFSIESRNLEDCVGAYLAEDLVADRYFPPYDRVTMDGIAIAHKAFDAGQKTFTIETTVAAGTPQKTLIEKSNCMEVMTGAIMPKGVDTVIRYEDLIIEEQKATIQIEVLRPKQNVHFKGSDLTKDTLIVKKGKQISSAEINIAASIGKTTLQVVKMPKTIIFSTGDELVPVGQIPEAHQVRRSNSYGIQASLKQWGLEATIAHLNDDKNQMTTTIAKAIEAYDLFIFTGGVSKGKYDYLPEVLETLKVRQHFHKVQQRPGKPFWFGSIENEKTFFALPGNPVSSFMCTYVYLKFWFQKSLGIESDPLYVKLKSDVTFKPDLVYFLQANLKSNPDGTLMADPIKGNGSGDFANLTKADGFLILPQEKNQFKKGEVFEFIVYRQNLFL